VLEHGEIVSGMPGARPHRVIAQARIGWGELANPNITA
jgi:hypothetical protein